VTLRQVDPFLPRDLTALYEALNDREPGDGKEDPWGGAAEALDALRFAVPPVDSGGTP
jgi:hypothetical protein